MEQIFYDNVLEHRSIDNPEYHKLLDHATVGMKNMEQELLKAVKILHKLGYSKKKIRNILRSDVESRFEKGDEAGLQLSFDTIDHPPTKYQDD